MPTELNGDYILYVGLEELRLHLVTADDGSLVDSTMSGDSITGTFNPATGGITMYYTLKTSRPTRWVTKHVYQGFPVSHRAGYRRSRDPGRFWGWAGYRYATSTRPVSTLDPAPKTFGWWARPKTSYAEDIQPLFRPVDIDAMEARGVHLGSEDWIKDYARTVYDAVAYPTPSFRMPCDGPWPKSWTTLFKYWMDDGKPS